MAGVTKKIFDSDIRDIIIMWNKQLKCISKVLPKEYSKQDVIAAMKEYYPHEWTSVEMKFAYYTEKDKYLINRFRKARYKMQRPEQLLNRSEQYKSIMSSERKIKYAEYFSEDEFIKEKNALWLKREPNINRINQKIDKAKSRVQQVTPQYIDQLIGLYEKENTSQKDRIYIMAELEKYYNDRIVRFFFKLNDTELNKQLRNQAFKYLQSFNYQPRARKQKYMQIYTENKRRREYLKNTYPDEEFFIPHTPEELEYRIANAKEQRIKKYDYFISHSYRDSEFVQKLIEHENSKGNNVFCDWINDSDYLKRHLLCEATLSVIESRLEQSDALIFVESEHSKSSIWCKYELNYFHELGKPIYTVFVEDIKKKEKFTCEPELGDWFLDNDYKKLALLKGAKIQEML